MIDNLKKTGKIILAYISIYIICSAMFISLFHTSLFSSMHVLMYRGILYVIITGIMSALCMKLCTMKWERLFDKKDIIMMFLGFCSVNMVLFTLIPVTVERSVSVFTLSYMEENPKIYTVDDMEKIFQDTYVHEFKAFDKRFEEQIVSGNIEEKDGGYILTRQGELTVKFFRVISKWINTDERLVYPNENIQQQ